MDKRGKNILIVSLCFIMLAVVIGVLYVSRGENNNLNSSDVKDNSSTVKDSTGEVKDDGTIKEEDNFKNNELVKDEEEKNVDEETKEDKINLIQVITPNSYDDAILQKEYTHENLSEIYDDTDTFSLIEKYKVEELGSGINFKYYLNVVQEIGPSNYLLLADNNAVYYFNYSCGYDENVKCFSKRIENVEELKAYSSYWVPDHLPGFNYFAKIDGNYINIASDKNEYSNIDKRIVVECGSAYYVGYSDGTFVAGDKEFKYDYFLDANVKQYIIYDNVMYIIEDGDFIKYADIKNITSTIEDGYRVYEFTLTDGRVIKGS